MKKKIGNLIAILGVVFAVWIIASWININNHNNPFEEDYQQYASWNYFTLIF